MTDFTKTFRRTTYPTIAPTAPSNDQSGRTVLVTGGSEGIGYGIAEAFAEAHAARIILVSRSKEKLDIASETIQKQHPYTEVLTRVCDASDISQMNSVWTQLGQADIFVDVLVLSAAAVGEPKSLAETAHFFHFNIISNLHTLDHFRNQPNRDDRPKCLININSATIHCYPYPTPVYAAGKAGLADYLCHIADAVPESEMRIIILHPGAVFTDAAERANEVPKHLPCWDDPSLSAHMALWTAGKEAAFLHGRFVWANWDAEELMDMKEGILADPAVLKVGITGVGSFTVKKLMEKCEEVPVPN